MAVIPVFADKSIFKSPLPENALSMIFTIFSGISILLRLVVLDNNPAGIAVIPAPNLIESNLIHPSKTPPPIPTTESSPAFSMAAFIPSGITIDFKFSHIANALFPILAIFSGSTIPSKALQFLNASL